MCCSLSFQLTQQLSGGGSSGSTRIESPSYLDDVLLDVPASCSTGSNGGHRHDSFSSCGSHLSLLAAAAAAAPNMNSVNYDASSSVSIMQGAPFLEFKQGNRMILA